MSRRIFSIRYLRIAALVIALTCSLPMCDAQSQAVEPPTTQPAARERNKASVDDFLDPARKHRIVAHRGYSSVAPENTIAAFRKALRSDADVIELDVQLSKDNHLVCMHDATLDRTTNGKGNVSEMPLPELKKLDAGGWFDKKFENERIPTLDEALDLLSGKRCIQIEIKLASAEVDHVEITRRVVEAVQERNLLGSVILSSFEPRVLKKARQLEPKLKIAAQYNRDLQDELSLKDLLQQTGADLVYVNHKLATRKLIDVAKEAEKPLLVYTVNDKTTAKSLKQRGITGFVTDDPEIFEPKKRASGTIEP